METKTKIKAKKRHRKRRQTSYDKNRHEGDLPRPEYSWLSGVNDAGGPQNREGIPPNLRGDSECPERTLAWVRLTCRFAKGDLDA